MRWLDLLLGRNSPEPDRPEGSPRLSWFAGQLVRYRLWLRTGETGSPWLEVLSWDGTTFETAPGRIRPRAVRAWVATHPGGTVVDQDPAVPLRLPPGARFLEDVPRVSHLLTQRDILRGRDWVSVRFLPCGARPDDPRHHQTVLRNNGLDAVRVVRFGSFRADGVVFRLDTITGGFFGEADFREWYDLPDGWLEPRAEVSDLTAFSTPGASWAYELETRTGERFWTGATRSGSG